MKIQITYFAILREQAGTKEEEWECTGKTTGDAYEELKQNHGFTLHDHQVKVAVNHQFKSMKTLIHEGDNLVFIPPVAGG